MFSFRTTSLFEQHDNALTRGRVAVLESPSAWYAEIDAYLWEIVARRWNMVKLLSDSELTCAALREYKIDALIIERQSTGDCYDPFLGILATRFREMRDTESQTAVYILDRYNPSGRQVEGVHRNGFPQKHGLTFGEVANMFHTEMAARFPLHIISADVTGAGRDLTAWSIPPYPDYSSAFSPYLHSGQYLWNGTNVSHGEGTSRPYEFFGAPYMKNLPGVEAAYNKGVYMRKCTFKPLSGPYAEQDCFGYQLLPNPAEQYNAYQHAVRLIRLIHDNCPEFDFNESIDEIVGDDLIMAYLQGDCDWETAREYIKTEEQKWLRKAKKYLLYDEPLFRVK